MNAVKNPHTDAPMPSQFKSFSLENNGLSKLRVIIKKINEARKNKLTKKLNFFILQFFY